MNVNIRKIRHIIYDWDGTLCDSIPRAFEATCGVFLECSLKPPTFADYVADFGPPFIEFYRKRGVTGSVSEKQIWDWYRAKANHHNSELFDDVLDVILEQRSEGFKVALVTCQEQSTIEHLFGKHGCTDLFDFTLWDAMPSKVPYFTRACDLMRAKPEEVYCVGDFASDMVAAKAAGTIPVGIVRHDRSVAEVLYQSGAARVITRLRDLIIRF